MIRVIPIPLAVRIRPGDDLAALLLGAIADAGEALGDGDALVVAQKPVS
jgi:F420-0:gamma-glutamyl ligase